jgi:hypothetical protein
MDVSFTWAATMHLTGSEFIIAMKRLMAVITLLLLRKE